MDVEGTARGIEAELRLLVIPGRAEQERRYLKSSLEHLGVPVPAIRKVARAAAGGKVTRAEVVALAETLWAPPAPGLAALHERRMAAIEVLARRVALLVPGDLGLAKQLIRESGGWVYVDNLADRVVGALAGLHPELWAKVDRWPHDEDFWVRRSALLALLPGIRAGEADLARLSRYGDLLIGENEFFVRKALGWALRELSKRDPVWVRDWTASRIDRVSGVTFREAVRRLPEGDREALKDAYKRR